MLIPRWHTRTGNRLQTWRCKGPNFWRNGGGTQLQVGSSLAGICCWEKQSSWKNLIYNFMKPQFREELKEVARQYGSNKENFDYEVSCREGSNVTCFFIFTKGSSWEGKTGGDQRLHRQANIQAINEMKGNGCLSRWPKWNVIVTPFTFPHPGSGTSLRRKTRTAYNHSWKLFPSESELKKFRDLNSHKLSCNVQKTFGQREIAIAFLPYCRQDVRFQWGPSTYWFGWLYRYFTTELCPFYSLCSQVLVRSA